MTWQVQTGKEVKEFESLKDAKLFARKYEYCQIIDTFGFVRFVIRNHRIFKI